MINDTKISMLVNIIDSYLERNGVNISQYSYADINKYPSKIKDGFSFSPTSDNEYYVILMYPSFEENISFIRYTLNRLEETNPDRYINLKHILQKSDEYIFIFSVLHEIGHIQHINELRISNKDFFDGIYTNNNYFCENYADCFSFRLLDDIYNEYIKLRIDRP